MSEKVSRIGPEADAHEPDAEASPEILEGEAGGTEGSVSEETGAPDSGAPDLGAPDLGAPDLGARIGELEDRIKRMQAEFLNETKRIQRQADERRKYAVEGLVGDLLPVFDALHSAREGLAAPEEGEEVEPGETANAVRQGLDLVEKEFLNVLGRHGVERIEAIDSPFDPSLHEAVYVVDDPDREPNVVAQVLRPGFTLNGRVVRPAHVAVTRAPQSQE